jgi:hypothetical protein
MATLLINPSRLLRAERLPLETDPARWRLRDLVGLVVVFGLAYGAVMGTFGGFGCDRSLQVVYSAVKVPLLLLATFAISLPSFFVFNTLLGVRGDFPQAVRALAATQAVLVIVLASLAPLTAVWYASSGHYDRAILFNAAMFAVASAAAQAVLRRLYGPLIARDARHRRLLRAWLIVYAFVGIQMGWVLRPFIGRPGSEAEFFRDGAWGNAYVEVAKKGWSSFRGERRNARPVKREDVKREATPAAGTRAK